MYNKHKLYFIAMLLVIVMILIVSSVFKAHKKVSSMLENKNIAQANYNSNIPLEKTNITSNEKIFADTNQSFM